MNRRGFSKISIIFFAIIFIILWAMFFGTQLSTWGHQAVIAGSYTGIEALFYENLNLVIGVIFFIGIFALGAVSE